MATLGDMLSILTKNREVLVLDQFHNIVYHGLNRDSYNTDIIAKRFMDSSVFKIEIFNDRPTLYINDTQLDKEEILMFSGPVSVDVFTGMLASIRLDTDCTFAVSLNYTGTDTAGDLTVTCPRYLRTKVQKFLNHYI